MPSSPQSASQKSRSPLPDSPFGVEISATALLAEFAEIKGWEGKYRKIIQLSRQLPALPDEWKIDEYLVEGCESPAWLISQQSGDVWHFFLDSDARIVKGLLVLVQAAFNGQTAEHIRYFDIPAYFDELGLSQQLSPSRTNGLLAVVKQIQRDIQSPK